MDQIRNSLNTIEHYGIVWLIALV